MDWKWCSEHEDRLCDAFISLLLQRIHRFNRVAVLKPDGELEFVRDICCQSKILCISEIEDIHISLDAHKRQAKVVAALL